MDDKLIKEINGNVAYIWINRPDKKNALDSDVWFGLPKIIEEINNSDEANCIVTVSYTHLTLPTMIRV